MILYAQESALLTCFSFTSCRIVSFSKFFCVLFFQRALESRAIFGFDSIVSSVE